MHIQDKKNLEVLLEEFKQLILSYAENKKYDDKKVTEIVDKTKEINKLFRKYKLLG